MQSRPEYSEIMNQTLHNFFVNSSNVSVISVSCHDNPMDWDLANLVAICFFQWNQGISSWSSLGQELMCEQVRHLAERRSCPTGDACSLWLDLAAAWWHSTVTGVHFGLFVNKGKLCIRLKHQWRYFLCQNRSLITCSLWKMHI